MRKKPTNNSNNNNNNNSSVLTTQTYSASASYLSSFLCPHFLYMIYFLVTVAF